MNEVYSKIAEEINPKIELGDIFIDPTDGDYYILAVVGDGLYAAINFCDGTRWAEQVQRTYGQAVSGLELVPVGTEIVITARSL